MTLLGLVKFTCFYFVVVDADVVFNLNFTRKKVLCFCCHMLVAAFVSLAVL